MTISTSPLECPFQRKPKFFNLRTFYHQNHLNKGHQNAKKLVSQVTSLFRLMQISKRFLQEAREAHTFPCAELRKFELNLTKNWAPAQISYAIWRK